MSEGFQKFSEGVSEGFYKGFRRGQPRTLQNPFQNAFKNPSKALQEGVEIDDALGRLPGAFLKPVPGSGGPVAANESLDARLA